MLQSSAIRSRRHARPGVVTLLVASILLALLSHPLIHGDGVAYFVYLDSVAGDGDLDLSNQAIRFAPAITYPFPLSKITGTPITPFPFGSAYLLAPFYRAGQWLEPAAPALRANPEHFTRIQGLPLTFSLMAGLGAHLYALAAIGLTYHLARRVTPALAAMLAAIGCLVGTPLLYYATVEPMDSHVYGAFAIALALWLALRGRASRRDAPTASLRYARPYFKSRAPYGDLVNGLAVGLAFGLAVLLRWQLLLYALPIGVALAWQARWNNQDATRAFAHSDVRRSVGWLGGFAIGLGLYCSVCALYFWRFFGAPLVIPNDMIYGQRFLGAPLRYLPQVLLSPHNGWLSWSPIAGLGLVGLAGIAVRERERWRAVALGGLAGIALQLALNASLEDWFGGWAFGQRRMVEAYPLLVVGLAWLIGRGRWRRVLAAAGLACALYGAFLLIAHLYYVHTSPHPEGGGIADVARWLLSGPHGPTLRAVFRDRYGPWAWARPEL